MTERNEQSSPEAASVAGQVQRVGRYHLLQRCRSNPEQVVDWLITLAGSVLTQAADRDPEA